MMKKLAFSLLFSIVSISIYATEFGPIGVIAGINTSNTYGENLFYSRVGFHFGVFSDIPLTNNLFFSPAIQILATRSELHGDKIDKDYLSVPLQLKYKLYLLDDFTFFVAGGLDISTELVWKEIFNENYSTDVSNLGLGLKFGVELFDKFQISLGRQFGVYFVGGEMPLGNLKNRNIILSAAFLF